MKNLLKPILFLVAFLMIACQKEELPNVESDLSQKARSWYEDNHDQKFNENPNFYGTPDWENYFQVENDIYFPLTHKSTTVKNQVKLDDLKNKIHVKSYLILTKDKNDFRESLKVFLNTEDSFNNIEQILKLPYLEYKYSSYNNNISSRSTSFFQSDNKQKHFDKAIMNISKPLLSSSKADCQTYYVINTTSVNGNPVHIDVLYSYEVCDGGSGGGNGSGGGGIGGGDGSRPVEIPHCSSWEYARRGLVKGASVYGMQAFFFTAYTDAGGIGFESRVVNFPTLYFIVPNSYRNGHAATATAAMMALAEDDTEVYFKENPKASALQVENFYFDRMKDRMREIGGSVSKNNPYGFTNPAPFVHSLITTGNCNT